MSELKVKIYTKGDTLPQLTCRNFFHSETLFHLCEQTPRLRPYMVVVESLEPDKPRVVAHMLAMLRYRSSLVPPYWYMHCRVYGEGDYETPSDVAGSEGREGKEQLFGMMIEALAQKMQRWVLYVEVSNLSAKMFGYRYLRQQSFFPVHWMSIHNSLHSRTPEERLTDRVRQRIKHATERGVVTKEVDTDDEFRQFMKLLRHHHWLKPKRYIPDERFFRGLMEGQHARLFITKQKDKVIGCCACTYTGSDAYLWYSAFLRKSYLRLHPDTMTVWHAITHAYEHRYDHIRFMDVGLPFRRNPFREFILSFGGKPVGTYRWFRCNIRWINKVLSWIYKD
ncbi:MAG: GNAT family N-acetyltransferase [Prevotella sp.]|nr:GNAT family N-acetyltransferase [Prevotella sp.]